MNIYKHALGYNYGIQHIRCRAVKILDIQIQNGSPQVWIMEDPNKPMRGFRIIGQPTGTDVLIIVDELNYISTTQDGGLVWHWFTDFGVEGLYQEVEDND